MGTLWVGGGRNPGGRGASAPLPKSTPGKEQEHLDLELLNICSNIQESEILVWIFLGHPVFCCSVTGNMV